MQPEDQIRFIENRRWFNQFFSDVHHLILEIHQTLASELGYKIGNRGWYYEKSNSQPRLPPYWLTGIAETDFALQIYLVLDTAMLEAHPLFTPDLSLVFLKHDRSDRSLWIEEGLPVVKNSGITCQVHQGRYMSGEIRRDAGQSTKYQAFQVPLSVFTEGKDIHQAILDHVVAVLKELPGWE